MNTCQRKILACALLVAQALLAPGEGHAQSGVATVAAEATIFENPSGANAGGYDNICVGNLDGFVLTRRAFARFDLPEIPPGSVVTRVVYEFTQVQVRQMGAGAPKTATLEMRRVQADWLEGEGIFLSASCGGGDDVPGVDWDSAPPVQAGISATRFLPSGGNTQLTIDTDIGSDTDALIADVQAWVDSPGDNVGWDYRITEDDVLDNARRLLPGSFTIYWQAQLNFSSGFESP
jgi:hypothetical protein